MRWLLIASFALCLFGDPASASAEVGEGEYPRERFDALDAIHARNLAELGDEAIRFSTQPALGGPSTVVEVSPDLDRGFKVRVSYLTGGPASNWKKRGSFHFWLDADDFDWLLGEIETAEQEIGANEINQIDEDGDGVPDSFIVCTDGPGYLAEIRSKGRTRWMSGYCGRNANNVIAPMMGRLVQYGTRLFTQALDKERVPAFREFLTMFEGE